MAQTALISAFLAGLLGGIHCVAMCGGWLAALAWRDQTAGAPLLPARTLVVRQLVQHAGRLSTYAALGAAFGGAGSLAFQADWPGALKIVYTVANVLLLAVAVAIARGRSSMPWLERAGLSAFARVVPVAGRLTRAPGTATRYLLGMLWGATPCGLVYGVLPLALLAGDAQNGALVMLAFGAGTLPNLGLAGFALARARPVLQGPAWRYAAAAIVAAFAFIGLYRVVFVPTALGHGAFCLVP